VTSHLFHIVISHSVAVYNSVFVEGCKFTLCLALVRIITRQAFVH